RLLEVHPKKLERHLKSEHTAFRILLEQTRKELAILMMQNSGMTLTQLALNLGYSEFSAFSRGFKGWFGQSPKHYWQHHQGRPQ
ncbi:MAG: helix-turn-helix domain-containing protein, partial [Oceanospirillum sp.]|nr:helix-turn-helix domain-containing protein [Oceanospirillum sp.]